MSKPSRGPGSFWSCVLEILSWHEQERFSVLKKVHSEEGKARAWLRAALNERSLERHLLGLLALPVEFLRIHYHSWAFLLDQENSAVLPSVAAGLAAILFAVRVDSEQLDRTVPIYTSASLEPVICTEASDARVLAKKPVRVHIVSFDDDQDSDERYDFRQQNLRPRNPGGEGIDRRLSPASETLLTPLSEPECTLGGLFPVSLLGNEDLVDAELEAEAEAALEAFEPLEVETEPAEDQSLSEKELRLRLLALGETLEQAREEAVASKLQLARFRRQHHNYLDRHELQVQTLNRENELLRQQLRKYVTAVQLLKKDSTESELTDEHSGLDYHKEAEEYQNKLIQVAEMHAELMEFNSRLTVQLTNKDRLLQVLRAELECLRGPINEEDMPLEAPCLIHIWIPSAFLTGQPSDIHHVYQVKILCFLLTKSIKRME